MRRLRLALLAAVLGLGAASCIDPLLGPRPSPDDPVENFDILWTEFDEHYSFFRLKGVDWDAMRDRYRPRVRPTTTEAELFGIVSDMLDRLRDGHINVFTETDAYGYIEWYVGHPVSYVHDLVVDRLGPTRVSLQDGRLEYGRPEPGVAYVRIRTFREGMAPELDRALAQLAPTRGLIVDLRSNGGGSDSEAREMAGRLVHARRLYRTVRIRNGPQHDDFTPPIPSYVEPSGPVQFDGPVAILTNRRTFSSAESFVLAARTNPAVTVVGDTTGGGSGYPLYRELPNGWKYRISRWIAYDAAGRTFEGVGLPPDHLLSFADTGTTDPILEKAIRLLTAEDS